MAEGLLLDSTYSKFLTTKVDGSKESKSAGK
jgi:hypothetical protein